MTKKVIVRKTIPAELKTAIERLGLSRIMTNKAFKFVSIILKEAMFENKDMSAFVSLPATYLMKVFNKEYHKDFFNSLKSAGIIESNEEYKQGSIGRPGYSKKYRLNPELLNGDFVTITYEDRKGHEKEGDFIRLENAQNSQRPSEITRSNQDIISTSTSTNISSNTSARTSLQHISSRLFPKSIVIDDLSSLNYDEDKLSAKAIEVVNSINESSFIIDEDIEENCPEIDNKINGKSYRVRKEKAIEWARKNEYSLIQDGRFFYIDNLEQYIKRKRRNVLLHFKYSMQNIKAANFYVQRNESNLRLDHNLTSMPKYAMEIIKADNDLVEIDLKNSQFAIHAAWLAEEGLPERHEDVRLYCELCYSGKLYDSIAKRLGCQRDYTKQGMLQMAFSKAGNSTRFKKEFRMMFPNVLSHIDGYKRNAKEQSEFAIELQRREARIFIDNIYPLIKTEGVFCLTKHDSLIISIHDAPIAVQILESHFDLLGFQGKLDLV